MTAPWLSHSLKVLSASLTASGTFYEIRLSATDWLERAAGLEDKGCVLVVYTSPSG